MVKLPEENNYLRIKININFNYLQAEGYYFNSRKLNENLDGWERKSKEDLFIQLDLVCGYNIIRFLLIIIRYITHYDI